MVYVVSRRDEYLGCWSVVEKIENLLVKFENLQIVSLSTFFLLFYSISVMTKILYPTEPDPMIFFDIFSFFAPGIEALFFRLFTRENDLT